MDPLEMPARAVSIESGYAVSVARRYVELVEAQFAQAESDIHSAALEEYGRIAKGDEAEYQSHVGNIERSFSEDYRPILRSTEVIYLHMVFEAFVSRHIAELQALRQGKPDVLRELRDQHRCGIARAATLYFQDDINWSVLTNDEWDALREAAEVRNCIVHGEGAARGSKYPELIDKLESREWQGQRVGIKIYRHDDGRDAGLPIVIHQRFVQYYLSLLERLFNAIAEKTCAEFWDRKRGSG
jgi:hypothetical protein